MSRPTPRLYPFSLLSWMAQHAKRTVRWALA